MERHFDLHPLSSYRVALTTSAEKELHGLPAKVVARIVPRLERLALVPRPPGCKKLKGGDNEWRIRIGDYRVFGTREKLPGFAHQKLSTKPVSGRALAEGYIRHRAPEWVSPLLDAEHLRTFGADDIDSGIPCPRAKRELRVGHSIRAQVGNFS